MDILMPIMEHQQTFDPFRFGTELVYSIIVLSLFLFIFIRTRKFYDISKHEGILYFRMAFLFFALAYLSRVIFHAIRLLVIFSEIHIPGRIISLLSLVFITYLSTLAIAYLIYSAIWKKVSHKIFLPIALISGVIAVLAFYMNNSLAYFLVIQMIFIAVLMLVNAKKRIRFFYALISLFWILNISIFYSRKLFPFEIKLALQIASLMILSYFIYRIIKWIK